MECYFFLFVCLSTEEKEKLPKLINVNLFNGQIVSNITDKEEELFCATTNKYYEKCINKSKQSIAPYLDCKSRDNIYKCASICTLLTILFWDNKSTSKLNIQELLYSLSIAFKVEKNLANPTTATTTNRRKLNDFDEFRYKQCVLALVKVLVTRVFDNASTVKWLKQLIKIEEKLMKIYNNEMTVTDKIIVRYFGNEFSKNVDRMTKHQQTHFVFFLLKLINDFKNNTSMAIKLCQIIGLSYINLNEKLQTSLQEVMLKCYSSHYNVGCKLLQHFLLNSWCRESKKILTKYLHAPEPASATWSNVFSLMTTSMDEYYQYELVKDIYEAINYWHSWHSSKKANNFTGWVLLIVTKDMEDDEKVQKEMRPLKQQYADTIYKYQRWIEEYMTINNIDNNNDFGPKLCEYLGSSIERISSIKKNLVKFEQHITNDKFLSKLDKTQLNNEEKTILLDLIKNKNTTGNNRLLKRYIYYYIPPILQTILARNLPIDMDLKLQRFFCQSVCNHEKEMKTIDMIDVVHGSGNFVNNNTFVCDWVVGKK